MRQLHVDGSLIEDTQARLFGEKKPFETGLIIGRLTESKDYAVALVPTCDGEGEDALNPQSWDEADETLITDHATIVSGMMPGGLCVIGIYAFCPSDQANSKSSLIHSILRKIYRKHLSSSPLGIDDTEDERHFLLLCNKTKRNTCKAFNCKDTSKGSHPAELKLSPNIASQLVKVKCSYKFSVSCDEEGGKAPTTEAALKLRLENALQGLEEAVAVIGGQCCSTEPICGALEPAKGGKSKGGKGGNAAVDLEEREVELYSHAGPAAAPGCARIQGSVSALAYVGGGESASAAATAVKRDIASSISLRLGSLLDEWDAQREEDPGFAPPFFAGGGAAWVLPRRAQFPIVGHVCGCVLIPAGGSADDCLEDVRSLFGRVSVAGLDQVEAHGIAPKGGGGGPAAGGKGGGSSRNSGLEAGGVDGGKFQGKGGGGGGGGQANGEGGAQGGGGWKVYAGAAAALVLAYGAECVLDILPFI